MNKHQRNIDLNVCNLHVREAEEGAEPSRLIEGYAVVTGVRSCNLTPWSEMREVYEVIEPGAITDELIQRSDVFLTAFHDNQLIMGRCTNGEGTLSLEMDEHGLLIRCELPNTTTGNDMLELIKRGDIRGMSFAFTDDDADSENGVSYERLDERTADGKEVWIRHVKGITGLYDVTIAGHPAYEQTTVEQKEREANIDKSIEAMIKPSEQEPDAEAEQKREAEEKAERMRKAEAEREIDLLMI